MADVRTKLSGLSRLQTRALDELLVDGERAHVVIRPTTLEFAMSAADALALLTAARARYEGDRYSHPYKSTHALIRKLSSEAARQNAAAPDPAEIAAGLSAGVKDALRTAAAPSPRHRKLLVAPTHYSFESALAQRDLAVPIGPYGTRPYALTPLGETVRDVLVAGSGEDGESRG